MSARILIVEDEEAIRESLRYAFDREGFDVDVEDTGEGALRRALRDSYDCILLDVLLPDRPGTDVCRDLRARSDVPIIIVSARGAETHRVVGLELGADDYVAKPFSLPELVARVRATLRRRSLDRGASVLGVGSLRLDLLSREVSFSGGQVRLTRSEFDLLALLAGEPGRVFSREEIMQRLWASSFTGSGRACDTHVANIRRKLGLGLGDADVLETVRGIGYRLVRV